VGAEGTSKVGGIRDIGVIDIQRPEREHDTRLQFAV